MQDPEDGEYGVALTWDSVCEWLQPYSVDINSTAAVRGIPNVDSFIISP
jgi:hypothetical protein